MSVHVAVDLGASSGRVMLARVSPGGIALDPIGRREVLELMARIKGEVTVFYSTHILDDVERVADHVAVLHHGEVLAVGTADEVTRDERVQQAYLGAAL